MCGRRARDSEPDRARPMKQPPHRLLTATGIRSQLSGIKRQFQPGPPARANVDEVTALRQPTVLSRWHIMILIVFGRV